MNGKIKFTERFASNPKDAKQYDTVRLRQEHLIENIFEPDTINMTLSSYDRLIIGGVMPVATAVELYAIEPLKAPFFLHRRELGIINVGGDGIVIVGDDSYHLKYKEALYLGQSNNNVLFKSLDPATPALFYFNSAPAHHSFPNRKVTREDAIIAEMGSLEGSNHRVINKLIVKEVLPTCQLQMGMTELMPGSVWNTMPAHTHSRRMEAYFYFELPSEHAVCHFMGQPEETRHIWMKNHEAVISPHWSIHSACATHNYTFIWGMAGENLDYGDMDAINTVKLR